MYLSTPSSRVIALDAETGNEIWKFDPPSRQEEREFNSHRGVSYWEAPALKGTGRDRRILFGTVDGRLFSLNAETGQPSTDFGKGGQVDLRAGGADKWAQTTVVGSARHFSRNHLQRLVIIGWGLPEFPAQGPSGDVPPTMCARVKLVWTFHTRASSGEMGHDTWYRELMERADGR